MGERCQVGERCQEPFLLLCDTPLRGEGVIDVVLPNPKPQVFIGEPGGKGAIFQRDARGPDFLPIALAEFFEL